MWNLDSRVGGPEQSYHSASLSQGPKAYHVKAPEVRLRREVYTLSDLHLGPRVIPEEVTSDILDPSLPKL